MVNEYLTRAYDTKVIFRELLCFYAPFGWVPVKENRAPSPNAPIHKMYDGNTVWSMEKQDYVSDYDVGRKRSEKIVVKRSTKFTRNNRLMTEEALMEYHLRFRYWLYPRCNRLRLINRCRPGWGILWAILFLACLFLTLTLTLGSPKSVGVTDEATKVSCEVTADVALSMDKAGDFYKVENGDILCCSSPNGTYEVLSEAEAAEKGVSYSSTGHKLVFTKDADGKELEKGNTYRIFRYVDNGGIKDFFATVYDAAIVKADAWVDAKLVYGLFPILIYILLGLNGVLFIYQLHSNLFLKKNTERIIECCINGKAIVQAMQYEDITLMNGRQRQRYYQGQVINEAARNTGDPLYFGS